MILPGALRAIRELRAAADDSFRVGRFATRWLRDRCNIDGAEHQRKGHKITFTVAQVEALRATLVKSPAPADTSITTGRKKKTA